MRIGEYYQLEVVKEVGFGLYLDSERGEILLPIKYVPEGVKVGDEIEVFLYKDSEDRLIATTLKPMGKLGDFVALEVTDIAPHGAFMSWGLEKDLFVPKKEQHSPFSVGEKHVVKICLDDKTDRLLGVSKLYAFFKRDFSDLKEGMEVDLLIYDITDIGYMAVVNQTYSGMLYKNEVFDTIRIGDSTKGFIKKLRDDDKIDLRIGQVGLEAIDENTSKLLDLLTKHDGYISVTDKSDPEEIMERLKMSKKAFKKAVGGLYKQKKILILEEGIKLVE
jgi:uncharacterized protein